MSIAINTGTPDSIESYGLLTIEIAAWLDRTDMSARIPGFIRLCESRLNRLLRVPDMESIVSISTTSADVTLPDDVIQPREVYADGKIIKAMSPVERELAYQGSASGIVAAYSIAGRTLTLSPAPAAATLVKVVYYAKLPPLSEQNATNWLLLSHPDIYLYGSLLQASAFIDDPERVAQWKQAYDEAIGELMAAGAKAKHGAGPIAPRPVTQIRSVRC